MDRSSAFKDSRSERISRSPYARPEQKARRPLHLSPVSAIKSIMSYVTNPFKAPQSPGLPSTNRDLEASSSTQGRRRRASRSVSGSEDEWDGVAPREQAMARGRGQDIFSPEAEGHEEGGSHEDIRRSARASKPPAGGQRGDKQPQPRAQGSNMPPRLGANQRAAHSLPQLSPTTTLASAPTQLENGSSPSVAALTAFLNAKNTSREPLRYEDYGVIDALTKNIKTESQSGSPPRANMSASAARMGGWSAGAFSGNSPAASRKMKSLRGGDTPFTFSTPQKGNSDDNASAPQTPGPIFSPGTSSTPNSVARGKVVYLGVGMSAKRKYGTPKSAIRPLFDPSEEVADSPAKKRRTAGEEEAQSTDESMDVDSQRPSPNGRPALAPSKSSSSLRQSTSSVSSPLRQSFAASSSKSVRPSPLGQSTNSIMAQSTASIHSSVSSPNKTFDAIAAGKRSASAILTELIEQEEILLDDVSAQEVVINPYERSSTGSQADLRANQQSSGPGTPAKSALGASLRASTSSPLRGAAAKMGSARGTKVSALERLTGEPVSAHLSRTNGRPPDSLQGHASRPSNDTPTKASRGQAEKQPKEPESQVRVPLPQASASQQKQQQQQEQQAEEDNSGAGKAKSTSAEHAPEPFKPLYTPQLHGSKDPRPTSSPAKSDTATPYTPTFSTSLKGSAGPSSSAPKFSTSFSLAPPEKESSILPDIRDTSSGAGASSKRDPSAMYLSAKDTALSVAQPALPFYTFTLAGAGVASAARPSEAVRAAALKATAPAFEFSLADAASSSSSTSTMTLPPQVGGGTSTSGGFVFKPTISAANGFSSAGSATGASASAEWTCSLCSCKSPGAAQKCIVCEEPRPAAKSSSISGAFTGFIPSTPSAPTSGFKSTGGEWTCSLCMCKSPDSAQKCVVCEEPRPHPGGSSSAAPAAAPSAPPVFQPFTGFAPGFAPQSKSDQWECSTCMCKNPESAKEKCEVCETPR